jgi:hypothetical protein
MNNNVLKKWIKLSNGVILDNRDESMTIAMIDNIPHFVTRNEGFISEIYGWALEHKTADELFELAEKGWLVKLPNKNLEIIEKNDDFCLETTVWIYSKPLEQLGVELLYAPITIEGIVIDYLLVYHLENNFESDDREDTQRINKYEN